MTIDNEQQTVAAIEAWRAEPLRAQLRYLPEATSWVLPERPVASSCSKIATGKWQAPSTLKPTTSHHLFLRPVIVLKLAMIRFFRLYLRQSRLKPAQNLIELGSNFRQGLASVAYPVFFGD